MMVAFLLCVETHHISVWTIIFVVQSYKSVMHALKYIWCW